MEYLLGVYSFSKVAFGGFPDNPVVKTMHFSCRGIGFKFYKEMNPGCHTVWQKKKKRIFLVNIFFLLLHVVLHPHPTVGFENNNRICNFAEVLILDEDTNRDKWSCLC